MRESLTGKLLNRELEDSFGGRRKIRNVYADRGWIHDLDIVNELSGHTGCVNALSWSKSGRLLASGSDDQHLHIHTYQPHDSTSQFSLTTTVATGHSANIFSVKFMPHSNDRTLVTAAGDAQVRVFDLEYSGTNTQASSLASLAAQRRGARRNVYQGLRYLSDGDTNCRVYRSHADRVKRIVTESSPHLFLTCSEDGEVRQWDLRLPSSAYPSPAMRGSPSDNAQIPPPLISYKRYNLDLNSISCSSTQPHYIALGGAHLHCFLHDRRMTGRDVLAERGASPISASAMSDVEEELMGQATRCVKKFAPRGKQKMRRTDSGHITACKISDAHPNEMVVSWSSDHIYSFDLMKSPDACQQPESETTVAPTAHGDNKRVRESSQRKRKRRDGSRISLSAEGGSRAESRQRTESSTSPVRTGEMALRVQYQNGQTEDIPIQSNYRDTSPVSSLRESVLSDVQLKSYRLAKSVVQLRKSMFTLSSSGSPSHDDPTGHRASFLRVLDLATTLYLEMLNISRNWRYPVDPSAEDIVLQRTLRSRRDSACRFVQAAGIISRALSGASQPASLFLKIQPAPNEGPDLSRHEQFGYDFLKAIFLWLDSGIGSLLEGFSCASPLSRYASRLPVSKNSGTEAVDEQLIPYLLGLCSNNPVINVDASRFEVDANRVLYATEREAVMAFSAALKTPFADLSTTSEPSSSSVTAEQQPFVPSGQQSRMSALLHWGFKVARGILLNAGEGVNFAYVDGAFGGLGTRSLRQEAGILERQAEIDPDEEEEPAVSSVQVVDATGSMDVDDRTRRDMDTTSTSDANGTTEEENYIDDEEVDLIMRAAEEEQEQDGESSMMYAAETTVEEGHDQDDDDDDEEDNEDADAASDDDTSSSSEDEQGAEYGVPFFQSALARRRLHSTVESHVPCSPHTRIYAGHCNVRTVKDVNFFGLDDEFVVSGSDDGNLFIWDRKTSQIVNILEGDGEVVNVMQGHPYEPMLAVSGIDHTVKIFSPDARAREAARLGREGVGAVDASEFSSIATFARRRPQRQGTTGEPRMSTQDADARRRGDAGGESESEGENEDDDAYVAPGGLASRKRMHLEYQITSQNDVSRRGGNQEAFVTRNMLQNLARLIRSQRARGTGGAEGEDEDEDEDEDGDEDGEGEGEEEAADEGGEEREGQGGGRGGRGGRQIRVRREGGRIVVDDDCCVM